MFARVAQLPSNPEDIEPLRVALGAQMETNAQKMKIHLAHVEAALGAPVPANAGPAEHHSGGRKYGAAGNSLMKKF